MKVSLLTVMILFAVVLLPCASGFAGQIIAWGWNGQGQCNVPDGNDFVAIAAGMYHGLALKSDGTAVAWGSNEQGQCDVPACPERGRGDGEYRAIAAGGYHNLALRSDGSIISWGNDSYGLTSVPWGNDFVAIAAGAYHNLALRSDGSLVAWGANTAGEIDVPACPECSRGDGNYIAIAAGRSYSIALRSDGSIVGWGSNDEGQLNIPDGNDFIAIAAGDNHGVALKADRSVVSWGAINAKVVRPPSQDFKAIAAGGNHCLALQYSGSVVGWGCGEDGQVDIPTPVEGELNNFSAVAAGNRFSLGIYQDSLRPKNQWYVSIDGSPYGDGSQENPWDLTTALCSALVEPGHTIWIAGGTYHGPFAKPASPSGTEGAPIVYQAMPGHRVTLTADLMDRIVLRNYASYVWFWGFEVTVDGAAELGLWGNAVKQETGTGCKYINMVVHDCPNRSGFYVEGTGAEFYGCLSYRNGRWADGFAHGLYCQNRPDDANGLVKDLPWMEFFDCIAFENFGWGVHSYSENDSLANMLYDGVVAYGNSVGDFISGGNELDDNFIVRNCLTYFPHNERSSVEFGYNSAFNGRLVVENSVFVGGESTVSLHNWQDLIFINNTCYTPNDLLMSITTPETEFQYEFDDNRYCLDNNYLATLNGLDYRTLILWQQETGWDLDSTNNAGEPNDLWIFFRPNKYEPDRAYLIIYNWPKTKTVSVALSKLWDVKKYQRYQYRIVSIDDIWGEPISEGAIDDAYIKLTMTGPYAPQFACFLVTRRTP